jgi:hypothetical protein
VLLQARQLTDHGVRGAGEDCAQSSGGGVRALRRSARLLAYLLQEA